MTTYPITPMSEDRHPNTPLDFMYNSLNDTTQFRLSRHREGKRILPEDALRIYQQCEKDLLDYQHLKDLTEDDINITPVYVNNNVFIGHINTSHALRAILLNIENKQKYAEELL